MNRLDDLLAQERALKAEIEAAKKAQKAEDLKKVRELCKAHGFTHNMLKDYLATGRVRKGKGE